MFADFAEFDCETSGATIHGVWSGTGPAVLLLHGIPQTHLMWRNVAPLLSTEFTVVATDLRGYGRSGYALPDDGGETDPAARHSMRELAQEQVDVMRALGHDRFAVVGHDRGARCAYRMALDHPDAVTALSVLDVVPTGEAFERADSRFALGYWVWSFLAAPSPVPETLIGAAPDVFVDHMLDTWAGPDHTFEPAVRSAYRAQFHEARRVAAICLQYRAAATVDWDLDRADSERSRRLHVPVQTLWSAEGPVDDWYDPIEVWSRWAATVQGRSLPCGHFLAEELPDLTANLLRDFLRGG